MRATPVTVTVINVLTSCFLNEPTLSLGNGTRPCPGTKRTVAPPQGTAPAINCRGSCVRNPQPADKPRWVSFSRRYCAASSPGRGPQSRIWHMAMCAEMRCSRDRGAAAGSGQAVANAHWPRSAFIGPAGVGRTSKSNMAVGTYSEQQALGMSTTPLIRPSMGEEPSSR
jgi:hypothetical protein